MITVDQSHHFHTSLSWSNGEVRESVEHVLFFASASHISAQCHALKIETLCEGENLALQ